MAVTQQPPITNNNDGPRLRLAPLLNPRWSINLLQHVLRLPTRHNEAVYRSQWSDSKHKSHVYRYSLTGHLLTLQHLDSDSYSLLGFVLIDAQGLCHYHLAEAAFT